MIYGLGRHCEYKENNVSIHAILGIVEVRTGMGEENVCALDLIQLTSCSQTHCSHGDERTSTVVERQIDSEQYVTAVVVQVYGEVDEAFARFFIRLNPADLRGIEADSFAIIQDELVRGPRGTLQCKAYEGN